MSIDELPAEAILPYALLAWLAYGIVLLLSRVRSQRSKHGVLDDVEGGDQADNCADDPDHDGREGCIVHARMVHQ